MAKTQNEAIEDLTKVLNQKNEKEINESKVYTDEQIILAKASYKTSYESADSQIISNYIEADKKVTEAYIEADKKVVEDASKLLSNTITFTFDDGTTEDVKVGN